MLRNNILLQYGEQFPPICFFFRGETCEVMANRNSTTATLAYYYQSIDYNLKELDDCRSDIGTISSRPNDFCLLGFLNEFVRRESFLDFKRSHQRKCLPQLGVSYR